MPLPTSDSVECADPPKRGGSERDGNRAVFAMGHVEPRPMSLPRRRCGVDGLGSRNPAPEIVTEVGIAHVDISASNASGQEHRVDVLDELQQVVVRVLHGQDVVVGLTPGVEVRRAVEDDPPRRWIQAQIVAKQQPAFGGQRLLSTTAPAR